MSQYFIWHKPDNSFSILNSEKRELVTGFKTKPEAADGIKRIVNRVEYPFDVNGDEIR